MPELVVLDNIKDWVPPLISRKRFIEVPRVSIDLRVPYAQDILVKTTATRVEALRGRFRPEIFRHI